MVARRTGGRKGAARTIQQVKSGALRRGYEGGALALDVGRPLSQPAACLQILGKVRGGSACALCDADLCAGRARGYGAESAQLLARMPSAEC